MIIRQTLITILIIIALEPCVVSGQSNTGHYSKNFILKGKVIDGRNAKDTIFANKPLNIFAFNRWRSVMTGPHGEYEVNFADTTGWKPSEYWAGNKTEILFGWGEDPNFTHTQSIKKLGIKKITGEEKFTKPAKVIQLNFKIRFEFED